MGNNGDSFFLKKIMQFEIELENFTNNDNMDLEISIAQ